MRVTMSVLLSLSVAAGVSAQEAAQEATPEATAPEARPQIRVLQHPYEISSFYRSGESRLGPWAGLPNDPAHRIADFYRSGRPAYGWSAFWTNGYAAPRPAPFRPYRRSIGENGDLFLAVPFLAQVGPISGAFFGY